MNGTCQCGGRVVERNHTITTKVGADNHGIDTYPATIEISHCMACGRSEKKIYCESITKSEENDNRI